MKRLVLLALFLAGCQESVSAPSETKLEPAPLAGRFDADTAGSISGRVVWDGPVPQVGPLVYQPIRLGLTPLFPGRREFANPNAPAVDAASRGVGQAIVFLRGIDPERSRPWDQPPVTVQMQRHELQVRQWHDSPRVGLVRRGESVTFLSRQKAFHHLTASGAAGFGLAFPEPDSPLSRRLERNGLVELSSGAGYFWMRAYLFVDEHPYYAATDDKGRFQLDQVPSGSYELVAWLPNWQERERHYNPETAEVNRLYFHSPVELRQQLTVHTRQTVSSVFHLSAALFESN